MPADITFSDLQFIIDFVYRGEIDVTEAELQVSQELLHFILLRNLCNDIFSILNLKYKTVV